MPKSSFFHPSRLRLFKAVHFSFALVLALLILQTGCASNGSANNQSSAGDIMTSSDMTDTRRRAIIRLQLAAGYLERGQFEVALDEVKRAISADPAYSVAYNITCAA